MKSTCDSQKATKLMKTIMSANYRKVFMVETRSQGVEQKIDDVLCRNGFTRSENNSCLYSLYKNGDWTHITLHVNDFIFATTNPSLLNEFEDRMNEVFTLKNLGNLKYYLGMQFDRDDDGIFSMHQKTYTEEKLRDFGLADCRPSVDLAHQKRQEVEEDISNKEVYGRAIESLPYIATNARPDIAVGTSILSRRVENPKEADWIGVKRIFQYLKKTIDKKLRLRAISEIHNSILPC